MTDGNRPAFALHRGSRWPTTKTPMRDKDDPCPQRTGRGRETAFAGKRKSLIHDYGIQVIGYRGDGRQRG